MYIGTVPNLPGAHTFAETIDDLQSNLVEVITLCLEEMDRDEIIAIPVLGRSSRLRQSGTSVEPRFLPTDFHRFTCSCLT